MKTIVRCHCGHKITAKDILRADPRVRAFGANYVWIKFRCSRCKHIGEHLVEETKFDWSVLQQDKSELTDAERDKFANLPQIDSNQLLEFHRQLKSVQRIRRDHFERREPADEKA